MRSKSDVESLEYFTKQYEFRGKHARMVLEMRKGHESLQATGQDLFERHIDILILAPLIGFRCNRRSDVDMKDDQVSASIFPEQLLREKDKLEFIMQMILLLDDSDGLSLEDRVNRAFRGASNSQEYDANWRLFNQYVLGGVEVLYEKLVVGTSHLDSLYSDKRIGNVMSLVDEFECSSAGDLTLTD
jgi:hypothetical protein